MRALEEVVLRTLALYKIEGIRVPGKTGVWIKNCGDTSNLPTCETPRKKIASLGVRISRWKTLHGFAINVLNCKEGFSLINPCGFTDIEVTSLEEEFRGSPPSLEQVQREVISILPRFFHTQFGTHDVQPPETTLSILIARFESTS